MTKIDRPGVEVALGKHARRLDDLERKPGQWIVIGTYPGDAGTVPESPPFENGWHNAGIAGYPTAAFYIDKWGRVFFRGAVTGGAIGDPITHIPEAYRIDMSEPFRCVGGDVQADPDGAIIQIA